MDRTVAFQQLYSLMLQKHRAGLQVFQYVARMKDHGIDDAPLMKAVIEEAIEDPAVRAGREEKEIKKDAIFAEFFRGAP